MIGIIGAMDEEIARLQAAMDQHYQRNIANTTIYLGKLESKEILLAKCGIGKVNAASLTTIMAIEGVKQLIFSGVAGALEPDLQVGDIVVSLDAIQHDVDVQALGYAPTEIPGEPLSWDADNQLIRLALQAAQELPEISASLGRIASGDTFLNDKTKGKQLYHEHNASCVEMEGAAMAQVAHKWNIPWVIIRSISDTANDDAHHDFRKFTTLAAEHAEQVVRAMLRSL